MATKKSPGLDRRKVVAALLAGRGDALVVDPGLEPVPILAFLAIVGIIYAAWVALAQTDIKRLVAYSSVSHMGLVVLGVLAVNEIGATGATLQMINHGIVTGALFLSVGIVYDRTHSRKIADYGGLATIMPIYAAFFMVFTLASIGLPATNGFVGEFLILLGGFTKSKLAGVLASTGIIIGAGYMLWLYQKIFFMEVNPKILGLPDMDVRESLTLIPLIILVFWIGVYPNSFLSFLHVSVAHLLERVHTVGMQEASAAKTIMEAIR